jgi:hypothetical protein
VIRTIQPKLTTPRSGRRHRPAIDALEDRAVPSAITSPEVGGALADAFEDIRDGAGAEFESTSESFHAVSTSTGHAVQTTGKSSGIVSTGRSPTELSPIPAAVDSNDRDEAQLIGNGQMVVASRIETNFVTNLGADRAKATFIDHSSQNDTSRILSTTHVIPMVTSDFGFDGEGSPFFAFLKSGPLAKAARRLTLGVSNSSDGMIERTSGESDDPRLKDLPAPRGSELLADFDPFRETALGEAVDRVLSQAVDLVFDDGGDESIWDRLPGTVAFVSVTTLIVARERVRKSSRRGRTSPEARAALEWPFEVFPIGRPMGF